MFILYYYDDSEEVSPALSYDFFAVPVKCGGTLRQPAHALPLKPA
jgi:hypothetical protein